MEFGGQDPKRHSIMRWPFGLQRLRWLTIAFGAGRRPESHVRNVSTATPRAAGDSAWERLSRVRTSLRADAFLVIGHDDAIGRRRLKANG